MRRTWIEVASITGIALWLGGCASTSHSYTLKIDASDSARIELCRTPSKPGEQAKCESYDEQKLETPARLNVEVVSPEEDSQYELSVEHHHFPAQGEDARRILGEVLKRSIGFAGAFVGSMESSEKLGGDPGGEKTRAESKLVEQIAALKPKLQGWALKEGEKLVGVPPPRSGRQESDKLFERWVGNKAFVDRSKEGSDKLFGEPALQPPPPRVARLNDADLTHLASVGIDEKKLGEFVVAKCKPEGFGQYEPRKMAWSNVAKEVVIDQTTVGKALLLDSDRVGALLRGGVNLDVTERIRKLNAEGHRAVSAGLPPSPEAETIYVANRLALLNKQSQNCIANVEFIAQKDAAGSYGGVLEQLRALSASTRPTAELFRETIAPYVLAAASEQLTGSKSGDRIVFGTVTVRPGTVELVMVRNDGASRKQVAQLSLGAAPFSTIAISVGPFAAACDDCYTQVEEGVRPGAGTTPAERVIREDHEAGRIGLAAAVHVSLWDLYRGKHHLGFMGGYPLAGGSASAEELLLGVSYRHMVGIQVGLGAHLFLDQELKDGISDPVRVSAPGNASLDVEAVSTRRPNAALFVMFGLSSDLFIDH
jgi:hypothetical protein